MTMLFAKAIVNQDSYYFLVNDRANCKSCKNCKSTSKLNKLILLATIAFFPIVAFAQPSFNLIDVIYSAKKIDKKYLASQTLRDVASARKLQATSLHFPQIMLGGTVGKIDSDTTVKGAGFSAPSFGNQNEVGFNTSIDKGNMRQWALSLKQNLYNPIVNAQSKQLEIAGDIATIQANSSEAELILRVSVLYSKALLAQQSLTLIAEQEKAILFNKEEADERFRLGSAPITDVHFANANLAGLKAKNFSTIMQKQMSIQELRNSIGNIPDNLPIWEFSVEALANNKLIATDLRSWQDMAKRANPALLIARKSLQNLSEKISVNGDFAGVSVDLVAQLGEKKNSGSGDYSNSAENSEKNTMVGVQVNIPLFTGGRKTAKKKQALSELAKAEIELERNEQNINLKVSSAWFGVQTSALRITALERALLARNEALSSVMLGQKIGDRTVLERINAENKLSENKYDLISAKLDWFLNNLKLLALAGELNQQRLSEFCLEVIINN